MKAKLLIPILIIVAICLLFIIIVLKPSHKQSDQALWNNYQVIKKTINGKNLRLVIAETPERQEKGLMFVEKPVDDFDGMIFMFPDTQFRTFWNKNTLEDLTLYWIDKDKIIGTSDLPSIEKSKNIITVSSPKPANIVVEVIK